jgi:hypothetical protein
MLQSDNAKLLILQSDKVVINLKFLSCGKGIYIWVPALLLI